MTGRKSVTCPSCGALPGQPCRGLAGQSVTFAHHARREAAVENKPAPQERKTAHG